MSSPTEARKRTPQPKAPRNIMPERPAKERAKDFNEVATGFSAEMAVAEALRCLQCKKPLCVDGCPVGINIPAFIDYIAENDFAGGARRIKVDTNLPAICGRVCPQEKQCEERCIVGKKHKPVSIGALERFVADWERESGSVSIPEIADATGKKVAVVGSGPAGLTAAGELARRGHNVTVFEALHEPGGVLVYGIPEFRLPKAIVRREVDSLRQMGVDIQLNALIGQSITVDELFNEGYDAVFIGTGAGLPYFLDIPGENLNGIYTANEFLTRVNLMKAYRFPEYHTPVYLGKRIAVFGGGNTAMDAARTSLRLGPEWVKLIYRRSEAEMPARLEEIHHGHDEGVEFVTLAAPLEFIGDEKGWLKAVRIIHMELGEPDASGRRRPVPIEGSEELLEIDTAIIAIGNGPNQLIPNTTPGLDTSRHGTIIADEKTGATHRSGVFAGGDIVTGAATVIQAMGAGKAAAAAIDEFLMERVDDEAQQRLSNRLDGYFGSGQSEHTDEERMALLYSLGVPNPEDFLNKPLPHWRARVDELLDPHSVDMMPIHVSHAYVRYVRGTIQALPERAKTRLFRAKLEATRLLDALRVLFRKATGHDLSESFAVHSVDLLDDVRQSVRVTVYDGGHRFVFDLVRLNPEAELIRASIAEVTGIDHPSVVPFETTSGERIALSQVIEGESLTDGDNMTDEFFRRQWPWLIDQVARQEVLSDVLGVADRTDSYRLNVRAQKLAVQDGLELFHYVKAAERYDEPILAYITSRALPDDPTSRKQVALDILGRYESAYIEAWKNITACWTDLMATLEKNRSLLDSYGDENADTVLRAVQNVRRWNPVAHLTRLYEVHLTDIWESIAEKHWAWRRENRASV